LNLNRRFY